MAVLKNLIIHNPVLLFDGVCNTCNSVVDFLLRVDRNQVLRFAPLQSEVGRTLLQHYDLPVDQMDTIVLIDNGKTFTHSVAVFQILKLLGWPWAFLSIFSLLPRFVTDSAYRYFSRNRYRWFGKKEVCRLLTQEERGLFLNNAQSDSKASTPASKSDQFY